MDFAILSYVFSLSDTSCVSLRVEFSSEYTITHDHFDIAVQFGVRLDRPFTPQKSAPFVVAFFYNLLLQREKIDRGLLTEYLNSEISKMWQEVLSSLEEGNRKVINIESGSLIFTLFCPNARSVQQLNDENWGNNLASKMKKLLDIIGKYYIIVI